MVESVVNKVHFDLLVPYTLHIVSMLEDGQNILLALHEILGH